MRVQRKDSDDKVIYMLWIYNVNGNMITNQGMESFVTFYRFKILCEFACRVRYQLDATLKSIMDQVNATAQIGMDENLLS